MKRRAGVVRPSLAELSRWRWWRLPAVEVAVRLCRVGLLTVWSSVEDVTIVFGGPRTGKTQWLAGRVLDAPGAVLVTSTRTDLLRAVRARCGRGGGRCSCSTPSAWPSSPSTITFDPLTGCADPVVATERATDMIAATAGTPSGGDREFWEAQARRVLAALLHAAALGGKRMRDVLSWVADPERAQRRCRCCCGGRRIRRSSRTRMQFLGTNDRTRTSITSTIMPALGWLTSPAAAAAAEPGLASRARVGFDVAELLAVAGDGVPARRGGDPGRPAGVRADRAHRPGGPPAGRAAAGRPARPAADAGAGRGRARARRCRWSRGRRTWAGAG